MKIASFSSLSFILLSVCGGSIMEFRTPNTVNTRWKHFIALSLGLMGCIVHPMFRIVAPTGTFWQSANCVISILNYVITIKTCRIYVKTALSNSTIILPGFSLVSRWPVSHSVFSTHSMPLLPCLHIAQVGQITNRLFKKKKVKNKLTFSEVSQFADKVCACSFDAISNRIFPGHPVYRCSPS